jgi:hypothetical protein
MGGRGSSAASRRAAPGGAPAAPVAEERPSGVPANAAEILDRINILDVNGSGLAYLNRREQAFAASLTNQERLAIEDYTSSSSVYNDLSRGVKPNVNNVADEKANLPRIDSGVDKATTDRDIVVYRGFEYNRMAQAIDSPQGAVGVR